MHSALVSALIRRWSHTPVDYTLEMHVEVEQLKMTILLSQPAPPPQRDSSPRRSPAVGTGLDESGVSRAGTQSTEKDDTFPVQASVDGFLHVSCTSPEQGTTILLQADIVVDAEETTTVAKAAAREEFARPKKNRQQ